MNLREKTEKWRGYQRCERDRTLGAIEDNPSALRESLREWLLALFEEGPCSMKRVNLLLYSLRATKIPKFLSLYPGSNCLFDAVVTCCGKYPNEQLQQQAEDKRLLAQIREPARQISGKMDPDPKREEVPKQDETHQEPGSTFQGQMKNPEEPNCAYPKSRTYRGQDGRSPAKGPGTSQKRTWPKGEGSLQSRRKGGKPPHFQRTSGMEMHQKKGSICKQADNDQRKEQERMEWEEEVTKNRREEEGGQYGEKNDIP